MSFPSAMCNKPMGIRLSCMQHTDIPDNILERYLVDIHTQDSAVSVASFPHKVICLTEAPQFQGSYINKNNFFNLHLCLCRLEHAFLVYLHISSTLKKQHLLSSPTLTSPAFVSSLKPVPCHWAAVGVSEAAGILGCLSGRQGVTRQDTDRWQTEKQFPNKSSEILSCFLHFFTLSVLILY